MTFCSACFKQGISASACDVRLAAVLRHASLSRDRLPCLLAQRQNLPGQARNVSGQTFYRPVVSRNWPVVTFYRPIGRHQALRNPRRGKAGDQPLLPTFRSSRVGRNASCGPFTPHRRCRRPGDPERALAGHRDRTGPDKQIPLPFHSGRKGDVAIAR